MKKVENGYKSFEFHTHTISEYYRLDRLESRSLLIDRPRYSFQQCLWIGYSYILKSKIEQQYFDEKALVIAEEGKIFEIPVQKILNAAYWNQIIQLKNFGTLDEGSSLYGTIYLKKIKDFIADDSTEKTITGIKWFDRIQDDLKMYVLESIGFEKLKDRRTKNTEIEEKLKQKFPELTIILIREFLSHIRKDLR
jgi:hypothetical protein